MDYIQKYLYVYYNMSDSKKEKVEHVTSKELFNFHKDFGLSIIYNQEMFLDKYLQQVSNKSVEQFNLGHLPDVVKAEFVKSMSKAFRYKRVYDIFLSASKPRGFFSQKDRWDASKYNSKDDNIITDEQINTIVRYSLDTPVILYQILRMNNYRRKEYNDGDDTVYKRQGPLQKTSKYLSVGVKFILGFFNDKEGTTNIFIDEKGNFVNSRGEIKYIPLGIASLKKIDELKNNRIFNYRSELKTTIKELTKEEKKENDWSKTAGEWGKKIGLDDRTSITSSAIYGVVGASSMLFGASWIIALSELAIGLFVSKVFFSNGIPFFWDDVEFECLKLNDKKNADEIHDVAIQFNTERNRYMFSSRLPSFNICDPKASKYFTLFKDIVKLKSGGTQKRRPNKNRGKTMKRII